MRTNRDIDLVFRGRRIHVPRGSLVFTPPGRPMLRFLAEVERFIDPVADHGRFKDAIAEGIEIDPADVERSGTAVVPPVVEPAAPTRLQRERDGTTFGAVGVGKQFWDPDSHTWMIKSSGHEATIIGLESEEPDLVEFAEHEAVVSVLM